jgi:hypothetical protein
MKKGLVTIFVFVSILGLSFLSLAQFTQDELVERAKWEELLKKGKVIKSQKLGQGVTKPRRLFLKKGDLEGSGVWKSPSGTDAGMFDKWEAEVAAYRLDKLLGLGMVPPTVERRYRGRKGSFQLFVTLALSEQKRFKENIPIPPDKAEYLEKMIYLARAFDSLIANTDRSQQNIRYTEDWRLILIDHSRSFRTSRRHTEKLIYGKYGQKSRLRFLKLPRAFVEKVRALSFGKIRRAVGNYLTSTEIEAVLTRRILLLKEIDEMIQERGEEDVLY